MKKKMMLKKLLMLLKKARNVKFVKGFIIKSLGGYTNSEYNRLNTKYNTLVNTSADNKSIRLVNEYIYLTLKDLYTYSKRELYGLPAEKWAEKMYNVISNNFLAMIATGKLYNNATIYRLDTKLEHENDATKMFSQHNEDDEFDFILNQIAGTD